MQRTNFEKKQNADNKNEERKEESAKIAEEYKKLGIVVPVFESTVETDTKNLVESAEPMINLINGCLRDDDYVLGNPFKQNIVPI